MTPRINDEINQALHDQHGFVQAEGADGKVIVMSLPVYREMMGVGSDQELNASLKAIDASMVNLRAGNTVPMDLARQQLDDNYGLSN